VSRRPEPDSDSKFGSKICWSRLQLLQGGEKGRIVKRILKITAVVLVILLLGIQFVPVSRTNPPVDSDLDAPAEIKAIFTRSCYDCHSHETKWRLYNYIAPISWWTVHHVEEAREQMNFSKWGNLDEAAKRHVIHECIEEIEQGEMPLRPYRIVHPHVKVSEEELNRLRQWAASTFGETK